MRSSIWLAVLLAGCPAKTSSPSTPMPVDQDPAWTQEEGPIAGPRAVVEGAPQEAIPSDTPGAGPWPPYLAKVRKAAGERHLPCVQSEGVSAIEPALVVITIEKTGLVSEVVLTRSSGSDAFDQCLVRALRDLTVPPPPPELLEDEKLVSKEIAFR
jgi:TonB family protein